MELFDTSTYLKPKKKSYKQKHFKKDNPYNQLYSYSTQIAALLPPEYRTESAVFVKNGLRVWYNKYGGTYEYNGEFFQEQVYMGYECEIIGTENWDISDRLKIHKELLELYEKNFNIDNSMMLIRKEWNI